MPRTIICGIGASGSRAAARIAEHLSACLGCRLLLAHVVPRAAYARGEDGTDVQAELLLATVAIEEELSPGAERRVLFGSLPAELAALAAAEDAELLVVGASTRRGPLSRLRANVADELARLAPCPLVVVSSTALVDHGERRRASAGPGDRAAARYK